MERTWVAELDRDVLRFVIAEGASKKRRIVHALSTSLERDGVQELRARLREAAKGFDVLGSEGYVLLSDRRLVHGDLHFDRLPRRNARDGQVLMAARELGLWDEDVPIAAAWRSHAVAGGGVRIVYDATQTSLLDEILAAVEVLAPSKLWVASLESARAEAFAHVYPGQSVAMLDLRASHASFVLCRDGRVESSRRFKLPFSNEEAFGNEAMLPLAMEVARSIEFLRDLGMEPPTAILVTGNVQRDNFDAEAWTDAFGDIETSIVDADFLSIVPRNFGPRHAWASSAFLLASRRAPKLCWLREPEGGQLLQRGLGVGVRFAASAALIAGVTLYCETLSEESKARAREFHELEIELADLGRQPLVAGGYADAFEPRRRALAELDRSRFSASRFCAALSLDKPERIELTSVALDSSGGASVTGVVRTRDRLQALQDFGAFNRGLSRVLRQRELGGSLAQDLGDDTGIAFEVFAKRRKGEQENR